MNTLLIHQRDDDRATSAAKTLAEHGYSPQVTVVSQIRWDAQPAGHADLVVVLSQLYKETETLELCHTVRDSEAFCNTPLLVAVNMYQMPLANRVKDMPAADFVFIPLDIDQFDKKVEQLREEEA